MGDPAEEIAVGTVPERSAAFEFESQHIRLWQFARYSEYEAIASASLPIAGAPLLDAHEILALLKHRQLAQGSAAENNRRVGRGWFALRNARSPNRVMDSWN
ncbi:MAG: hypothetical protein EOS76_02725 [Mesorhizobium sp.]|uniref:hypothetical protein n=1 Tax=unclassified Mesorhizobium TaxID=325217 RepID=UPI000F759509|nr:MULTISPECIES: hypothetical protein [unclassified Mesorhizobium]AZO33584.1 hypothetical protein EJ072_02910 [Mesorhizobium sp. M2A.F.Ca.ET.046.03.2.1]RVC81068.1 hypothetical protein EN766_04020 [Mesorhizobium sp. M2A.F.Ca.ET.046.02.1.1]RWB42796.1 MAG: hypothetical protein EOQ44_20450 [Mesorhizobium sp.]RWE21985.1 MAG: hypothetical protein EOS76_02725 [Mesorhizobium sp.]